MIVENAELGMLISLLGVLILVLVHLFVHRFRVLQQEAGPWISLSAGVAIAYVFVDVLPLLAKQQSKLVSAETEGWLWFLKHHAYLVALAGFAFHYAIALSRGADADPASGSRRFILGSRLMARFSLISLLVYSFLIGYLIGEKWDHDSQPGLLFAIAMAVHFVGLNHLAYEEAPKIYKRWLRFQLAATTLIGWVLAISTRVSDVMFFLAFSFLAGGIIVVAMSVELPRIRPNAADFLAFVGGLTGFTVLLLIAEYLRDVA